MKALYRNFIIKFYMIVQLTAHRTLASSVLMLKEQ